MIRIGRRPRADLRVALLSAALVLASAGAGCGDVRSCKPGTLFVTVTFSGGALAADSVLADVTSDGQPPRSDTFDHAPGATEGSIEIVFPQGYPAGRQVQVALTAQQAGAAVASATGAATLAAGCGTLSINLGGDRRGDDGGSGGAGGGAGAGGSGGRGGGGGDAGVDAARDRNGGADGPRDGTSGGGDTTGGGGAPGDAGIDAPGADTPPPIDAGVDRGCVFQSAEDCYNGIDDDCNGHTDCDDPACAPSTVCVPAAGSTGFAAGAWVDPTVGCPARFDAGESTINATLNPGAGCTGCSCRSSITCAANLGKYTSSLVCSTGLTTPTPAGSISLTYATGDVAPKTSCLVSTFTSTTEASVGAYVTTSGPCVAQGTAMRSTPGWTTSRKFCGAGSIGAGCSPGYVCVPKVAPNHCVMALGAKACPAGYTKDGGPWYTGFTDTRTCGACTCGTQAPGSCAALQANFYFGTSTTCTAGVHRAGGSGTNVCNFSNDCASAGFGGTPTLPSCPGVSSVGGTLTATGEQTLCCF